MIHAARVQPWLACALALLAILGQLSIRRTNALLFPYKRLHNASHVTVLTPEEWASEFDDCNVNITRGQPLPIECLREPNSWLTKHSEELWYSYRFMVAEPSVDERYANLVYSFNSRTGVDFHHQEYNTGDPMRDKLLERQQVVGPQVDDQLCKQQLRQMAALLDDLSWRVQRKRKVQAVGSVGGQSVNGTTPSNAGGNGDEEDSELDERHFRLGRVLDSFGRYESGHLSGRYHSFGMYNQCGRTQMLLGVKGSAGPLVDSRYCWAHLGLDQHLNPRLRNTSATDYNAGDLKFHLAVCLPASCHSRSLNGKDAENLALVQRLVDSQLKRPRSMWLDQSLPVEHVYCLADPESEAVRLPLSGKLFVAFILGWTGLCIFATRIRGAKHVDPDSEAGLVLTSNGGKERAQRPVQKSFWSHLDLFESWHEFIGSYEQSRQDAPVDLDTLSPIKGVSGCLVLIVHSILMVMPLNVAGLESYAIMENNRGEMLMVTGFLVIDSLFVLTGLLMTFIILKRLSKLRTASYSLLGANFYKTWIFISASRYLRLVPLYFLAFWFKKSVFAHLGSGPNWDYGFNRDTLIGACKRESWLSPLTPMTAFTPMLEQCLPQSWSISNDLVFGFLAPPFILLLWRNFRSGALLVAGVTAGAIWYGYYVMYMAVDPGYRFMLEQLTLRGVIMIFREASQLYTNPFLRVPAYFVGVFSGFALFHYEQRQLEHRAAAGAPSDANDSEASHPEVTQQEVTGEVESGWPKWFRGFATQQAVIYILASFTVNLFFKELRDYMSADNRHAAVRFLFLNGHLNWSLAIAVIFLRMVTDWKSSWLMRISTGSLFRATAKLAYPIILIHWDVLYYDAMNITQATLGNKWQFGRATTMAYMYTWPLSIFVHVVLENPIDKLTKTYLLGARAAKTRINS